MTNALLILAMVFLVACGKSSNDEVTATTVFYGSKDGATEVVISKMTFLETRTAIGRYQVTQAVIKKSDGTVLKSSYFCGEFESISSVYALKNDYGDKNYSWVNGFYESPYLADNLPVVAHLKTHANSAYIDTALANANSCL